LEARGVGPNSINTLFMSNQMVKDITSAKNVFGHQASGGVCGKGDLCMCRDLMDRLFERAKAPMFATEQGLIRLVCANIPSGVVLNFPQHAQLISTAMDSFLTSQAEFTLAFEPSGPSEKALVRETKTFTKPRAKKAKTRAKVEDTAPLEPTQGPPQGPLHGPLHGPTPFTFPQSPFDPRHNPMQSSTQSSTQNPTHGSAQGQMPFTFPQSPFGMSPYYCTASVHVTHTSYGPNHVQRVVANFHVGGVPMNDLFTQLNTLFAR
jgi:hypothetical protein